jgi:lipopolysaccharide transport system ATP-binding protein
VVSNILRDLARPFARTRAAQPTGPIVVLDDFFPNLYSGFRVAEYNAYLERFPNLIVRSSSPDFATAHAIYAQRYPHLAARVLPFDPAALADARLAYFMFLHNAHTFLPYLTQVQLPFVFTLNPGGSFGLNDRKSDAMLDPVIASPLLRNVIATQNITRTYLRDRGVPPEKITLIYGGVMNARYIDAHAPPRPYYPQKPVLDVAFIAHKYVPMGANKGFPEFCALASRFADDPTIAWHVVGHNFEDLDWPTELARPQAFTFHGLFESTTTLYDFLLGIDLVVSPQRPFLLYPGSFDSMPTMGIVEASLQGAAMICSDVLKMNDRYRDGTQIVIAPPEVDALYRAVLDLKANPKRLQSIAKAGQRRSRELFSSAAQLRERFALLERYAPAPPGGLENPEITCAADRTRK